MSSLGFDVNVRFNSLTAATKEAERLNKTLENTAETSVVRLGICKAPKEVLLANVVFVLLYA